MYSFSLDGMACSYWSRVRSEASYSGFGDYDVDGLRETAPVGGFLFKLASAGLRQRVKLGLSAGLAFGPLGNDPTLLFEAMQGGVK